jgi:hypothetical protein
MRGSSPKLDHCGGGGGGYSKPILLNRYSKFACCCRPCCCNLSNLWVICATTIQLVGEGCCVSPTCLEGRETVVDVLVETRHIIAHRRWWMMMVMRRLIMMLQSRMIVVLRSIVWERSTEAVVDAPCGERHAPSLYTAHGLLIIVTPLVL